MTFSQVARRTFSNRCPRCAKGAIYAGFLGMKKKCSQCGYAYEREPGYFLGAMVFSYFIGGFSVIPTIVIGLRVLQKDALPVVLLACAQVAVIMPVLMRYSRLLWIAIDFRADPKA